MRCFRVGAEIYTPDLMIAQASRFSLDDFSSPFSNPLQVINFSEFTTLRIGINEF